MAELSQNGQYVKLTVKVWREPNGERLHITGADPDLRAPGIHLSAKRGSKTEDSLNDLMQRMGVSQVVVDTPKMEALRGELAGLSDEQRAALLEEFRDEPGE